MGSITCYSQKVVYNLFKTRHRGSLDNTYHGFGGNIYRFVSYPLIKWNNSW